MDTSGFYKKDGEQWYFAPNFVYNRNYTLERTGNRNPVDGWEWHGKAPQEYIDWLFENGQLPQESEVDKTPPTKSGLKVEIPSYWEVFFPDDTFILNGFIVELERINGALAVDIAYLQWANFQAELDKPSNEAVKRHMMPIWDYVIEQINQNNFIP
jgi:hypothetical protein